MKKKEYVQTKLFLRLKAEYLKNDDKYIKERRKLAKRWLTEKEADKLLSEVRERS